LPAAAAGLAVLSAELLEAPPGWIDMLLALDPVLGADGAVGAPVPM
jgi:hypothetical protein